MKRKHTILLVCLLLIFLISLLAVRELLSKEDPQGGEYEQLAKQLLTEAFEDFERIRGVSLREVSLEVVNKDWVIENWGKGYADPEIEDILREETIYKALLMVPENTSLYQARLEWTAVYTAAVWQGRIYVVQENFDVTNEVNAKATLIHELTHILQEGLSISRGTFDGDKSKTALMEGDATFMADIFKNQSVTPTYLSKTVSGNVLTFAVNIPKDELYPSLPQSISAFNWFPYDYGVKFIKLLYEDGGWAAVDQAYENPPTTTEQIIHLESYSAKESFQQVNRPLITDDWVETENERFGEYFIQVMLDNWIPEADAEKAASGWGGDNFTFYEREDEYLFTWNITWDSIDDAHEFYIAFQEIMYEASAEKRDCSHWFANGRYLQINWNEESTLIVSSTNQTMIQKTFFD